MNAQDAQIKGHIKEIAGLMAHDRELQKQGRSQRRSAEVQARLDQVKDAMRQAIDAANDRVADALGKAKLTHKS